MRATARSTFLLEQYIAAGFIIGNHTHSHPDIDLTSPEDYISNIFEADKILSSLSSYKKLFRFTFLKEGDSVEKRDAVRAVLKFRNYLNAYITVNTYDWYMDGLYQKALKEKRFVNMDALKTTYVQVLVSSAEFYDNMAKQVLGRSPKHVILLHENDLAALFIGDLVTALRTRGWKIISPELAYTDEVSSYQTPHLYEPYPGRNPGRIGEIARDSGWPVSKLWHEACDEKYLENLFLKNGVYSKSQK
jgi:peptidoglycan/xylan/chitin deacetylase (PgdA/CDA1 family)